MSLMLNPVLDWFSGLLLDCLNGLIGAITHVLLITPDVTALPQVRALAGHAVWVVDTVFVLVFLTAGLLSMVSGGGEKSRFTVKDLLPRCVVAFVAAHFSQLLAAAMINLANAFTTALSDQSLDRGGALQAIQGDLAAARDQTAALLFICCLAIILGLLAATACSVIVRFTLALVLTAVAPLALACHALPQTDGLARLWWRSYAGVLLVPAAQGFVLFCAQWMLLDPAGLLPQVGLPTADPGGVINLFVVVVLLWMTVRVPSLMGRLVTQGRGGTALGTIVRVLVVQQLSRAIPGLRRRPR